MGLQWKEIISESLIISSIEQELYSGKSSLIVSKYEENIETLIPNTLDISATLLPTLPKPTIPIFLPLISFPFNFFFSQRPLWVVSFAAVIFLSNAKIKPIVCSAVAFVLPPGVLL